MKKTNASKIRRMIEDGYSTTSIVRKLGVPRQSVYNMRYRMRMSQGLGALPVTPVAEQMETGIQRPEPPRSWSERVKAFFRRLWGRT